MEFSFFFFFKLLLLLRSTGGSTVVMYFILVMFNVQFVSQDLSLSQFPNSYL
jgi:hypothetical protein